MQYISLTTEDRKEMLKAIGVSRFEDLISSIPPELRMKGLALAEGMSEMELLKHLRRTGQRNSHMDRSVSFLGAGNYEHYIPPLVNHLATRGEFLTAYTPYQAEASQGTLQTIYEFQSLVARLTGMDVANASMYDGASSLAEAALMGLRVQERRKVLIADTVHPESIEAVETYLANIEVEIMRVRYDGGVVDLEDLERKIDEDVALVVFQTPNFLGLLEDAEGIVELTHRRGALAVVAVNPLSLALVSPPGEYGADIAVGEGQPLGNPVSYGGPHFGFFATTEKLLRRLPGRLCGITEDLDGKRAFVLTLQAREQHIRREKATSNICTNHALCALKATVFLALLGEEGFRRLAELNVERSHQAFRILQEVPGVEPFSHAPFFNEFALRIKSDPSKLRDRLRRNRIMGPLHLARFRHEWRDLYLVAVTEQRTMEDIGSLVRAIREAGET